MLWLEAEPPFRGIGDAYLAAIESGAGFYLVINAGRRSWGGLWYRFTRPVASLGARPRHVCPEHRPEPAGT